ncbi:flagellar hook assembly protein FlgD [Pseudemcibacter aquimaris]|uniref:flagellar hook assembly protein FlgD n=1 Tax=Pseudemcibacter aquimaris TaxID=2857064 RepID=UPI002012761C|nr:flagellar hook assembly protein FlgD [Pseudemcibacter aquimaris]MCC3862223.1 flagellar hook assembly protein FlgD [Pseudemcibacter aquimaris]WDU58975.1 flagellar hook assembly protein FlgD [Pseudemcibacter aquimaris]
MDIGAIVGQQQAQESAAGNSAATLAKDFDNFLSLLTTQLQYQDPLSPMDSNQFTQQLVAFTGVEQAIATNQNLEAIVNQNNANKASNAVNYLGREVIVETNKAGVAEDGTVNWEYTLDASASTNKITIRDENGFEVDSFNGELKAGTHELKWPVPQGSEPGIYRVEIEPLSGNEEAISHSVYSKGVVTGVEKYNGDVLLAANGILTSPNNVLVVREIKQEPAPAEASTE